MDDAGRAAIPGVLHERRARAIRSAPVAGAVPRPRPVRSSRPGGPRGRRSGGTARRWQRRVRRQPASGQAVEAEPVGQIDRGPGDGDGGQRCARGAAAGGCGAMRRSERVTSRPVGAGLAGARAIAATATAGRMGEGSSAGHARVRGRPVGVFRDRPGNAARCPRERAACHRPIGSAARGWCAAGPARYVRAGVGCRRSRHFHTVGSVTK